MSIHPLERRAIGFCHPLAALRAGLSKALWLHERRQQRRALLDLTDDQLDDIGVTRAEARREASKPFWR